MKLLSNSIFTHTSIPPLLFSSTRMTQSSDSSKAETMSNFANDVQHAECGDVTSPSAFERTRSTGSIMISPELFEKLYLNPKTPVAGNLRSIIGNPTPMYGSRVWIASAGNRLTLT